MSTFYSIHDYYISHHGIKGQKWGVRRFQNPDGSLTELGKKRYGTVENMQRSIHAGRTSFAKSTAASVIGTAAMSAATKSFTPMIYGVSPTAKTYRKDLEADTGAKNLTKNIFKSIVKTAVLSAGMSLIKGKPTLKLAIQLGPTYSKIKDKKVGEIAGKKAAEAASKSKSQSRREGKISSEEFEKEVEKERARLLKKQSGNEYGTEYDEALYNVSRSKPTLAKEANIYDQRTYATDKAQSAWEKGTIERWQLRDAMSNAKSIPKQYASAGGKDPFVKSVMSNAYRALASNDTRQKAAVSAYLSQMRAAQSSGNVGLVEILAEDLNDYLNA